MPEQRKNWLKTLVIRGMREGDSAFLREMLVEADFWRGAKARPAGSAPYLESAWESVFADWGRRGDLAVVATNGQGERIGAAWLRLWTEAAHLRGFVDERTPELGIGVRREFRRHGVGTALLMAVLSRAQESGVARVSLSVDIENVARLLYERFGFRLHSVDHGVATLLVELIPERADDGQGPRGVRELADANDSPATKRSPGTPSL